MLPDDAVRLNVLLAYPYATTKLLSLYQEHGELVRFLLDSGAFTAWKLGKRIELDDYCRFIETLPVQPWRYFTLDVIGDPAGTLRNYELMLKRGFKPIPIFTRGEDPSVLDDYYRTSDVVGIGGLVKTLGNRGFVNGIMKWVGKRRCHWLGFTSLEYLKHYRPYMCDSSSWEAGARYGGIKLYLGGGHSRFITKRNFTKAPSPEVVKALISYGVRPNDLAKTAAWAGSTSMNRALGAHCHVRESLEVQRQLGTLSFLAHTTTHAFQLLHRGFIIETGRRKTHAHIDYSLGRSGQRDSGLPLAE